MIGIIINLDLTDENYYQIDVTCTETHRKWILHDQGQIKDIQTGHTDWRY